MMNLSYHLDLNFIMKLKNILFVLIAGMTLLSCSFFSGLKSNVEEDGFLYVKTNSTIDAVLDSLQGKLKDIESFRNYAEGKDYAAQIKPGKYKLEKGETNSSLLDKLIDGKQVEVHLMIKNEPTIFHLAGSVSKKIEADSTQLMEAIVRLAKNKNLDAETVKYYF